MESVAVCAVPSPTGSKFSPERRPALAIQLANCTLRVCGVPARPAKSRRLRALCKVGTDLLHKAEVCRRNSAGLTTATSALPPIGPPQLGACLLATACPDVRVILVLPP
jgi:hypothetical protein